MFACSAGVGSFWESVGRPEEEAALPAGVLAGELVRVEGAAPGNSLEVLLREDPEREVLSTLPRKTSKSKSLTYTRVDLLGEAL